MKLGNETRKINFLYQEGWPELQRESISGNMGPNRSYSQMSIKTRYISQRMTLESNPFHNLKFEYLVNSSSEFVNWKYSYTVSPFITRWTADDWWSWIKTNCKIWWLFNSLQGSMKLIVAKYNSGVFFWKDKIKQQYNI